MGVYTLFNGATPGSPSSGAGNPGTTGLHIHVTAPQCTLAGLWHWSSPSDTQLPTSVALYSITTLGSAGTLLTSNAASWSGAVASGWVFAPFTSPPALSVGTEYMPAAFRNDNVNRWFSLYQVTWPVSNGPVVAPQDESTPALSQGWYNNSPGTSLAFPNSQASTAGANFGMDVQVVTPGGLLIGSGIV